MLLRSALCTGLLDRIMSDFPLRDYRLPTRSPQTRVLQNRHSDSSEIFNGGVIMVVFPDTRWVWHLTKLTCYLGFQFLTAVVML